MLVRRHGTSVVPFYDRRTRNLTDALFFAFIDQRDPGPQVPNLSRDLGGGFASCSARRVRLSAFDSFRRARDTILMQGQ